MRRMSPSVAWISWRMRSSRRAWGRSSVLVQGNCLPTGPRRGALRMPQNRGGWGGGGGKVGGRGGGGGLWEGGWGALVGVDAESEGGGEGADGAWGGVDLLEDAVFAQGLGPQLGLGPGELLADGAEARCAADADEQVRVDGGGPCRGPVVEPCGEADEDGAGERDVAAVEGESPVGDVAEFELLDLLCGERVVRDERDGERGCGVGRVQRPADGGGVEGQRDGGVDRWGGHAGGGVGEDERVALEHGEQRQQAVLGPARSEENTSELKSTMRK